MNNTFNSITQYDKSFDGLFDDIKKKGYSCSYFSILSCWRFMENGIVDKDIHEQNIRDAMTITCVLNIADGLSFEDLIIGCTDYDHKKILATNVDLMKNDIIGIHQMFPLSDDKNNNGRYAVMFLKSEKYFVVLVDDDGYHFRDCHADTQFDFKTLDQLYFHLSVSYQFTENICLDGIEFEDYSSIEFLIFDKKFNTEVINVLLTKAYDDSGNMIQNDEHIELNEKNYDLDGDIFDLPEKIELTKDDIRYLEMFNNQANSEFTVEIYDNPEEYNLDEFTRPENKNINAEELVDF